MPRRPRAILLGGKIPFSIFNGCTSMIRTQLSVNLNKVALVRNSREGNWPDPVFFGRIALEAGAAGLTVHPRPDERHIRRTDLAPLKALVDAYPGREFNIEGNPFENLMPILKEIRPHQATFVPEAQSYGCRVSLFMDPEPEFTRWAKETGSDRIELYTEGYAAAYGTALEEDILQPYVDSALLCDELALGVNAGHDLSLENLEKLLTACGNIQEVSIGHALTVEALQFGFAETIRRYNELLDRVAAKPRVFPQE